MSKPQVRQITKTEMKEYGDTFRFMRQLIGYTSFQMAEKIGVENYNLLRWERGVIPNVDIRYVDKKIKKVFKEALLGNEYLYKKYKNIHKLYSILE